MGGAPLAKTCRLFGYYGNVSTYDSTTIPLGALAGWVQHGGPQWGRVLNAANTDDAIEVDGPDGPRQLKRADIAVWVPPGPTCTPEHMAAMAGRFDVVELWRVLAQQLGETNFHAQTATATLGMTAEHAGAIWLMLWQAPAYFARKGRAEFRARSAAEHAVESARLAQRLLEERTLAAMEEKLERMRAKACDFAELVGATPVGEAVARTLAFGEPPPELDERTKARIEKILAAGYELEGSPWPYTYNLAAALGSVDPWANGEPRLAMHRRWLNEFGSSVSLQHLEPLTPQTELWAIDDEETIDRDDAIGVCRDGDTFVVEIAIADVTAGQALAPEIMAQAATMSTTLYLPTTHIPMLPAQFGSACHSLSADAMRPVFLLRLRIDAATGAWRHEPELSRGMLKLTGVAAYVQLDAGQKNFSGWTDALDLAAVLYQRRLAAGADDLRIADIAIDICDGHPTGFRRFEPWHGARYVVREAMILANHAFATLLWRRQLPAPYRSIVATANTMVAKVETKPAPHIGLGVDKYLYATSPIRRFADILAQRQILSLCTDLVPMSEPEMRQWLGRMEPAFNASRRWMDQALRYWKLRYLEAYPNTELIAVPEPRPNDIPGTTRVRLLPLDLVFFVPYDMAKGGKGQPATLVNVDADRNRIEIACP